MHETINRLRAKKADEGFTLIELLVVVVIIGVLVAIAVPVYLNYRKGAADKSAQSDVRGAVSAVEQYYTDNGNQYPADIPVTDGIVTKVTLPKQTNGNDGTVTLSDGTKFALKNNSTTYVICATNTGGSNKIYVYTSNGGGSVKASTATTMASCLATP
ncbi:prepilin-type N-terminal cleavage/methylation domain-containing protein [Actinoplanes sp. KI2]|uniref:prepilin-type N-terminal cleavage/methylation domain-containing protein n=1 Tax=Actinoplanes sp. KI2 TaxID=2983315 RepID=UPI0021D5F7E9|nr:prepilin-type N-terminal cleavage/methylation domain-containing protein [Actinoplanes sp. KI2]MCU7725266.1 prepilin-type N-terminal cleavage/methylation domain-containing protein [Actinoplanes sp. KI2]